MPIGYDFMTTNLGFLYTLQSVAFETTAPLLESRSSVSYLNNTFENCEVVFVNVYLRKGDSSIPGKGYWYDWGLSSADATASCDILTPDGKYTITFLATYNGYAMLFDYLVSDNYTTHASAWWGSRLLNNHFNGIEVLMSKEAPDNSASTPDFTTGQMTFGIGNGTSIRDPNIFTLWYYCLVDDGAIINQECMPNCDQWWNNDTKVLGRVMTEGIAFAKVMHSLILVDLGNIQLPNLLLDPDSLQYACSVPVRKSITTIILLALMADYAIMQFIWGFFKFWADLWVEKKYQNAMYCAGCNSQGIGLVNVNSSPPGYSPRERLKSSRSSMATSVRGLLREDDLEEGYHSS